MKMIKQYTIGELADAAGISRRAVRFYVQTGVIAAPIGKGRGSYYTDEHFAAIRSYQKEASSESLPRLSVPARDYEYVVRITLLSGAVLELPGECKLPSAEQVTALEAIIKTLY